MTTEESPAPAGLRIRPAGKNDAPGIAAVIHAMEELRAVAVQPVALTAATVGANLGLIQASDGSTAYVAETSAGGIVGYAAVHWVPFLFLPGGEAYVTELFIHPSASAKGIGSAILDAIVGAAKQRGCARVSLLNGRDGASYRRGFYKKRGWVERERMANFILPLAKKPDDEPATQGRPG